MNFTEAVHALLIATAAGTAGGFLVRLLGSYRAHVQVLLVVKSCEKCGHEPIDFRKMIVRTEQ